MPKNVEKRREALLSELHARGCCMSRALHHLLQLQYPHVSRSSINSDLRYLRDQGKILLFNAWDWVVGESGPMGKGFGRMQKVLVAKAKKHGRQE